MVVMVMGTMPLQMLMGSAPMEMQVLGAGAFDFLLTTAELVRLLLSAGMICLNLLILIESLYLGICLMR